MGLVRNLVKASNLSVSKVRQFLISKPSCTKFTLATREFKRMKAFARLKNEIWCMDLAYVDKLAKDNNGVKYLLVRQDLLDRAVDAKGMKTKDSKETVRAFLTINTKKNRRKKIGLTWEQNLLETLKNICKAEGIQIYSIMKETKAAFAERTIRSLKNMLYRYMEDNGYKYIHKLTQFATTLNSRRTSFSRYSCKQHIASFFPMLKRTSTIRKFTILMDCMRTNPTFPTTSREPSLNTREFRTARGTTLSEPFFTRRMNINPNASLAIVDCSLYTRRIALKDDYHKKRMDMLAYTHVEFNYLETFPKTFIIPARQNQFIQENIFNNAPVRRIAIAMNTNSAFT